MTQPMPEWGVGLSLCLTNSIEKFYILSCDFKIGEKSIQTKKIRFSKEEM